MRGMWKHYSEFLKSIWEVEKDVGFLFNDCLFDVS